MGSGTLKDYSELITRTPALLALPAQASLCFPPRTPAAVVICSLHLPLQEPFACAHAWQSSPSAVMSCTSCPSCPHRDGGISAAVANCPPLHPPAALSA